MFRVRSATTRWCQCHEDIVRRGFLPKCIKANMSLLPFTRARILLPLLILNRTDFESKRYVLSISVGADFSSAARRLRSTRPRVDQKIDARCVATFFLAASHEYTKARRSAVMYCLTLKRFTLILVDTS